jgi:hypothetical protein
MQRQDRPSPLQAKAFQELQLSQVMAFEILARAAFYAHSILGPTKMAAPRNWAHQTLAQVLDEVEMSLWECEGRA